MTDIDGDRRPAGELEASVLAALWAAGTPQSAAQVRAAIAQDLARTTVATLLGRLREKGMVGRRPGGRGFVYFAVQDAHGLTARRMHRELDQVGGDRGRVLARFVEGLDPDDEAELRRLVRREGNRAELVSRRALTPELGCQLPLTARAACSTYSWSP